MAATDSAGYSTNSWKLLHMYSPLKAGAQAPIRGGVAACLFAVAAIRHEGIVYGTCRAGPCRAVPRVGLWHSGSLRGPSGMPHSGRSARGR